MIVRCTASALIIRSLPVMGTGTDTGHRMVNAQHADAHGTSLDGGWLYVDAPAARGWCSRKYLTVVATDEPPEVVTDPAWPKVPHGEAEIRRLYGSPGSAVASAGRVQLPAPLKRWDGQTITVFACHKLLEDVFTSVFAEIHRREFWSLLETYDGCYNDRTVTSSQKTSVHAWGIGVDLNAATNRLGAVPKMDRRIVAIFDDHGFQWGGEWNRPDGMHFQRATGY
jgi:hypothetical protein